jgi:hypothetical protein
VTLSDEVECDEAYVIAGHKGQPEVVQTKGRQGRRRRLKGQGGRGTLEKERPPVFGMVQRGGQVVLNLLANVKQKTIEPLIKDTIMSGTLIVTVQVMKTGLTPQLAPSDHWREAEKEPLHPAEQLHTLR